MRYIQLNRCSGEFVSCQWPGRHCYYPSTSGCRRSRCIEKYSL